MKSEKNQSSKRNRNNSVTKAVVSAKRNECKKRSDTTKQQTVISKRTKLDTNCSSDVSSTQAHGHIPCENQVL
jgi:hypothetical protein